MFTNHWSNIIKANIYTTNLLLKGGLERSDPVL